jgi:glycosyltransferase involved in cell wall biosynthesis
MMNIKKNPTLTIFYQFDPWRSSIGGIQTFIGSFLKYAPPEFEVRLVGTGDRDAAIGKWSEQEFAGRAVKFMPVIRVEHDDVRKLIPTTLKYTAALFQHNLASDFMHFNRLEVALATRSWQGEKILFIHNDIQKQMSSSDGNNAILWQKFPQIYFALEKFLIEQFNHIYSCHTETAQLYQQKYPNLAQSISYLKNTVDEQIFYPLCSEKQVQGQTLAQEMGLAKNTRFVLFAGRLHPQKDPLLLIDAFASLNLKEKTDVHLLMAGAGELEAEIRVEIAKNSLAEKVTMLGAVTQLELARLHRVSSVFVLSSVYEGLPLTVLEALSSGTPVVTTNSGETPKFLGADSGIVCYERTPEAIADALKKILQNPHLYPSTACVRTAKPYSAKNVVTDVYQKMFERWESRSSSSEKIDFPLSLTS